MTLAEDLRMEESIAAMYAELEPAGPQEYVRFCGTHYSANNGKWRRSYWALSYLDGPMGRLPK